PWTITPAIPTFSNSRASAGAVSESSSQPRRIFTVTGTLTDLTTASTSATAVAVWHIKADPPPVLTTLLTGQPMLISTAEAPWSTTQRAANSISWITLP